MSGFRRLFYIVSLIRVKLYEFLNSDAPWLTADSISFLNSYLNKNLSGIEWGSGRSTKYLATRVKSLISVENDRYWYNKIKKEIRMLKNVEYIFQEVLDSQKNSPKNHPYVDILKQVKDNSIDFALIDGKIRLTCIENVIKKIKPGGIIILDNAECYFFSKTFNKILYKPLPPLYNKERWDKILSKLDKWDSKYTSNGVWSTTIWINENN